MRFFEKYQTLLLPYRYCKNTIFAEMFDLLLQLIVICNHNETFVILLRYIRKEKKNNNTFPTFVMSIVKIAKRLLHSLQHLQQKGRYRYLLLYCKKVRRGIFGKNRA